MPKQKTKKPDFTEHACGHFLSDWPSGWSPEQIIEYLEGDYDSGFDIEITPWAPFEDYDGETLAGYIRDLADKYEAFYNRKV